MSKEEKEWISDALKSCEDATRAKVTILLVRMQDSNDESDVVVTNGSVEFVREMAAVIRAENTDRSVGTE